MPISDNEQYVSQVEKIAERRQLDRLAFQPAPDVSPIVSFTRVSNFTCPACNSVLQEAVAINGVVRGWCGNSCQYIKQKVSIGGV